MELNPSHCNLWKNKVSLCITWAPFEPCFMKCENKQPSSLCVCGGGASLGLSPLSINSLQNWRAMWGISEGADRLWREPFVGRSRKDRRQALLGNTALDCSLPFLLFSLFVHTVHSLIRVSVVRPVRNVGAVNRSQESICLRMALRPRLHCLDVLKYINIFSSFQKESQAYYQNAEIPQPHHKVARTSTFMPYQNNQQSVCLKILPIYFSFWYKLH